MPPKPKNTREEIAAAAFEIIKQEGLSALTARRLGKSLDSSASTVFTVLPSMEAVKLAARELALAEKRIAEKQEDMQALELSPRG